eukprot:s385_g1.t1
MASTTSPRPSPRVLDPEGGGYGASQPQRVKLRLRVPAGVEDAPEAEATIFSSCAVQHVEPSIHQLCLGASCRTHAKCLRFVPMRVRWQPEN